MVSNVVGKLLELPEKLTHVEAVHQGVVGLNIDGQHFPSVLVEEFAEYDADIGIGGDWCGLNDLGEGDPGGAGDEDQPRFIVAGLDETVAALCLLLAHLTVNQEFPEAAAAVGPAVDEGAVRQGHGVGGVAVVVFHDPLPTIRCRSSGTEVGAVAAAHRKARTGEPPMALAESYKPVTSTLAVRPI